MVNIDDSTVALVERHSRACGAIVEMFNKRWADAAITDEAYIEASNRVQAIGQEVLDLLAAGLL
jgi:hypothetical protein